MREKNDCKMQRVKKIFAYPSLFWVAQVGVDHQSVSFDITGGGIGILRDILWIQTLTPRQGGCRYGFPAALRHSTASPEAESLCDSQAGR